MTEPHDVRDDIYERYSPGARVNHWVNAILIVCLALSGLSLFHPSLFFLTSLFGGGQWTRIIHPWLGVVAIVSFVALFVRFVDGNFWTRDDTAWLRNIRYVLAGREDKVPDVGKYNAGQKLLFWGLSALFVLLIVSGLALWDEMFGRYTTIDVKRLAAVVHALAALALIATVVVHIYAAIWVRGSIGGMVRGRVTGGWAWRHHRKWLRQEAVHHAPPSPSTAPRGPRHTSPNA